MKQALTYDDVNIIPKYSQIDTRSKIELYTRFTKNTKLSIPIVSSPMDTITEYDMAKEMMDWGGVGVIHRFQSIKNQAFMMRELHYEWDRYFDDDKDWYNELEKSTDKDHREIIENIIESRELWVLKPLCAAIGVTGDWLERAKELVSNGCNVLLIDVAHGHHKLVGETIDEIKKNLSGVEVIAGSVATGEATKYLCEKGADAIRVGIGNGSLCETRIRTGVGIPQVTALINCVTVADTYNVPVIADGGICNIGDVCKGLACGADSVMLGSLLSGTKETPGSIEKVGEWPNEQLYKKYRGSASLDSKLDRGEDKNVEGNSKIILYKGKLKRIISDIKDGIRSSCSYVGASNLEEFRSLVEFVEVTNAGINEAKLHIT
jgi:IMP dehydrogenase